ncbi:hypothetical protein KP509_1Z006600 [Ceratopteris richardii]|nr:hypothetical protein KP509_1Z006600 [Ceratopteris richardii]
MEAFPCYGISICEGESEQVETLWLGEHVMDLRRGKKGVSKDLTQGKEKRAAIEDLPIPSDIPWMKELSPSWMQEKESKINIEESSAYPQCIFEDQNEQLAMSSQPIRQVNLGNEEHSQPILLATWLWDHLSLLHQVTTFMQNFKDVFASSYHDLEGIPVHLGEHSIPLIHDAKPIRGRIYRLNPKYAEAVKKERKLSTWRRSLIFLVG